MEKIIIILLAVVLTTSCMTTKTNVGNFQNATGKESTYAKGKQFWIFWGIFPLGRTNVNTPADGNCQVVTRFSFGDILISGLTGGLVSSYTIRVNVKK